jgi:hypothetical protein
MQITDTILMIRPASFRKNEETAVNNYFQKSTEELHQETNAKAQNEFDAFVEKLRKAGINIIVVEDLAEQDTPDALFPNNWVSFHQNGTAVLYPMFAVNRRRERRKDIFDFLEKHGCKFENIIDLSTYEAQNIFLEGTGSLILDRVNKKAYCALSPRADKDILDKFCQELNFTPVVFNSFQTANGQRLPIYHTNVMMCIAENFAVICLDTIDDPEERNMVVNHLKQDGKEIIAISEEQMNQFAGNMLQVKNKNEDRLLVMSKAAHDSLNENQIQAIEKHCPILSADLTIIETNGGGSARCMMAEVFYSKETSKNPKLCVT